MYYIESTTAVLPKTNNFFIFLCIYIYTGINTYSWYVKDIEQQAGHYRKINPDMVMHE